jgi:hypothetical protein
MTEMLWNRILGFAWGLAGGGGVAAMVGTHRPVYLLAILITFGINIANGIVQTRANQ